MNRENARRAVRSHASLRAYCLLDGDDRSVRIAPSDPNAAEAFDETVSDLLGDLMHLADRIGHQPDWPGLLERGRDHHDAEVNE